MVEGYHTWCYETTKLLIKTSPLKLAMMKQAVGYHESVYAWTEVRGSKWVRKMLALVLQRAIVPVLESIRSVVSKEKRDLEWKKH